MRTLITEKKSITGFTELGYTEQPLWPQWTLTQTLTGITALIC